MPTQNKTQPTTITPNTFIESHGFTPAEQEDARTLVALFEWVTGEKCVMWGKIFGFGQYHYRGKSSEGEWMKTGFALRKTALTIYLMAGTERYGELLKDLGTHKVSGGSCVYVKKLADIDLAVLEKLIRHAMIDIKTHGSFVR